MDNLWCIGGVRTLSNLWRFALSAPGSLLGILTKEEFWGMVMVLG